MSKLSDVKHCIEDNFNTFLDKKCYTDLDRTDRCGHSVYCDNMFVHHNPLYNSDDYNYFVRCVERFRELLSRTEKKMFIISIINGEHNIGNKLSDNIKAQFVELNNVLKTKTTNYKLVLIVNYPNKIKNNYVLTELDNLYFLEVDTLSLNNGIHFCNEVDDKYLCEIMKKLFKFKLLHIMNTNT